MSKHTYEQLAEQLAAAELLLQRIHDSRVSFASDRGGPSTKAEIGKAIEGWIDGYFNGTAYANINTPAPDRFRSIDARVVRSTLKPSDIFLARTPPFTDTFQRSECEVAAALLVLACVVKGDQWQPVGPLDMKVALEHFQGKPGYEWFANPFCRPDFYALVDLGFATWVGDSDPKPLRFTDAGMQQLRTCGWVVTRASPARDTAPSS